MWQQPLIKVPKYTIITGSYLGTCYSVKRTWSWLSFTITIITITIIITAHECEPAVTDAGCLYVRLSVSKWSSINDVTRRGGRGFSAAWRHARHICVILHVSWLDNFHKKITTEIISTYQNFEILCLIAYVSNVSKHTKNFRCVWNSYRSVGYTTDCKGGGG